MRYIKLYEAFESNIITGIKRFLSKKIGKENSNVFSHNLKKIFDSFGFPISKLNDDNITYISSNKAIYIKPPENWVPLFSGQLYFLKFWFSLEKGYLGFTGVGKEEIEHYNPKNKNILNKKDFNHLKKIGIKTGELTPVVDYKSLKTGDKVVGLFNDNRDEYRCLTLATIYISDNVVYAIQNVSDGGCPTSDDWRQYGNFSWNIYRDDIPGSDHHKLNLYKESDKPIDQNYKYNKVDEYLNFNLPLDKNELTSWDYNNPDIIKKSEFCMIINIDNIIKSNYTRVDSIQDLRKSNRESATALYPNEYILDLNIDRYMTKILHSMNIDENTIKDDFKNLNRIVKIVFANKYPIYNLNRLQLLDKFISTLIDMIRYNYSFKKILDLVKKYKSELNIIYEKNTECEKLILNSENEDLKKIYKIYKSINEHIMNYINGLDIKTLKELKELSFKFQHVMRLMSDDYTGDLESNIYIYRMDDVDRTKDLLSWETKSYTNDIEKLNFLEKSIKSIFK